MYTKSSGRGRIAQRLKNAAFGTRESSNTCSSCHITAVVKSLPGAQNRGGLEIRSHDSVMTPSSKLYLYKHKWCCLLLLYFPSRLFSMLKTWSSHTGVSLTLILRATIYARSCPSGIFQSCCESTVGLMSQGWYGIIITCVWWKRKPRLGKFPWNYN